MQKEEKKIEHKHEIIFFKDLWLETIRKLPRILFIRR